MYMERYISRLCNGCNGHGNTVGADGILLIDCQNCRGRGILALPVPEGSITQKIKRKTDPRVQACYAAAQLVLNRGGGWKAAVRAILQIADDMRDET